MGSEQFEESGRLNCPDQCDLLLAGQGRDGSRIRKELLAFLLELGDSRAISFAVVSCECGKSAINEVDYAGFARAAATGGWNDLCSKGLDFGGRAGVQSFKRSGWRVCGTMRVLLGG